MANQAVTAMNVDALGLRVVSLSVKDVGQLVRPNQLWARAKTGKAIVAGRHVLGPSIQRNREDQ
jgi:hypothetical protein